MRIEWPGWTHHPGGALASVCDRATGPQIGLRIRRLEGGFVEEAVEAETAFLLLMGQVKVRCGQLEREAVRKSVFSERPCALLVPAGQTVQIATEGAAEFAQVSVENEQDFAPTWFGSEACRVEQRGLGVWNDAAHREVRTLMDDQLSPPRSNLVLGEVMAGPGRWSSYPPHFHDQPEIYHYRFDHPSGYGHAELSEEVFSVRQGDTMVIPPRYTHAQCAAPGYGMWYLWAIRHLPEQRYTVPTFSEAHRWLLSKD